MQHRTERLKHAGKDKIEFVDEIFFEIEKSIGNDLLQFPSNKDKFCATIRDLFVKEKIYRNPALTRDALIAQMGVGRDVFIKGFQYCFEMSFKEFVNRLRLKESVILLEQSDLPIEEISERVGFGSIRTFQRQFMAMYKTSPKDYRKSKT